MDKFLQEHLPFTLQASNAPPHTVIELRLTLSEAPNTRLQELILYAAEGFSFLDSCLSNREEKQLADACESSRRKFGKRRLNGARMTLFQGVQYPATAIIKTRTPPYTPEGDLNSWFLVGFKNSEEVGWSTLSDPYEITHMEVKIDSPPLPAIQLDMVYTLEVRYHIPVGAHMMIIAPSNYIMYCAIRKMDLLFEPTCTQDDLIISRGSEKHTVLLKFDKPADIPEKDLMIPNYPHGMTLQEALLAQESGAEFETIGPIAVGGICFWKKTHLFWSKFC